MISIERNMTEWKNIRSKDFTNKAKQVISSTIPFGLDLVAIEPVRTAHYAAYKVTTNDGSEWLARIGATSDSDNIMVDNSSHFGTSSHVPTGQLRETIIAHEFHKSGANVLVPKHYDRFEQFDIIWTPFINSSSEFINASQWYETITGLQKYFTQESLPTFTNRAKSMKRLDELSDNSETRQLKTDYDTALEQLFDVADKWSVVHGDAHAGNALVKDDKAFLFDFDTVCWAPSVWDITHLINRAGKNENIGYSANELLELFDFSETEVKAALKLRKVASKIAKKHNKTFYSQIL